MTDWFSHMRRGGFAAAWAISDAILAQRAGTPSWHLPRHEQWLWDGTPLAGKRVLIRCYHGLGDTIQFARFFPLVENATIWAQPSLIPLLQTIPGIGKLMPLHDGTPDGEYDVDVESMELAHVFRVTPETIPRPPYLHVDPAPIERGRERAIGVVWEAGEWDSNRAIAPEEMRPLLDTPGVRFCPLHRDSPGASTPLATARMMRALDLVITVDTMTAHLAGALGVPVFTLLPYECDWRWMSDRDDSPWYPSMRLFRQPRPGDWKSVIDAVRYAVSMEEEEKKSSLNEWGIDLDKFKERAKESLAFAKGDLSEITGTLRQTLVQAKDVVMNLQTGGAPAAAELKSGFERAWHEIEAAFKNAREKAKAPEAETPPTDPPPTTEEPHV